MEDLREFICESCNMVFHSVGLLNKHKTKFCIGTDLKDPVSQWRGRMARIEIEKTSMKKMHSTRARTPDLIILNDNMNQTVNQKESPPTKPPDTMSESNSLSKLTKEFQRLRMSIEDSLPRRQTEEQSSLQQKTDEGKALQLSTLHEKRLAEIRAHNQQLEKERQEIEQRLAELAGHDRTIYLEEVLYELRYQEQKNEEVLHQLSSQISSMKGPNQSEVPSNPPVDIKMQHLHFDLISSVDGPLSAQIRALRLAYMQSGGSDPEVLANMHDLQTEALTQEQTKPKADRSRKQGRRKSPHSLLDPELLAVEQENQKLEEEIYRIQMARVKHKGLNVIQKDHVQHMASLQADIAYLKREIEQGRERRPPHNPPTSPTSLFRQPALSVDEHLKQHSPTGHHVIDLMETFGSAPYDPVAGFVIFYDLVVNVDATMRSVRLLAGLYFNGQKLGHSSPMPIVQCLPSTNSPTNYAILAVKQSVPRIQASPYLSLVVEIRASEGLDLYSHENGAMGFQGWAKLELFDRHNQINSGHWKLPFRSLPVQVSLSSSQLNSIPQVGNMELCIRVVNACDEDVQTLATVDQNNTNQYNYPSMVVSNTPLFPARHGSHHKRQALKPEPASLP